ncbi:phage scaffolding protein [Acidomonas methanolica]|uniref:Phage minor structual protein GP20 n=1 Tax=Acidomonas methanolica NBRC 104435 TaxID=1231351 RepID=A0A023D9K6_ACIMT|nr:hypothetical protein [Acidomonas methanolica]MBU2655792.1 phage scaffolding protein [Acidomonas methanolica]MCQ9154082.1 hypothetical protein [Acidomonas methanolica]TCS29312.1 hypothetical protein EDC31_10784 [Acidomonas methanolica]GAJ30390.1 Phage minor structual protein GP20 [Acidomonas methanolica NBRC 104435]GBQ56055.1 phage minor structual protein GP20 [Acidomonas methanolica]
MSEDVEELRRALESAQGELSAMRDVHEAALARVRAEGDQAVIAASLRAEAMRLGAHNPDDVVRLMDRSEVARGDDGEVRGVAAAIERCRRERGYLFSAGGVPGTASGSTFAVAAPRPGEAPPFDARKLSDTDYAARKWQFLAGK